MSSSANVLKCNNCNLVVNELLTFVQHKHEVMDSESLVRICSSAFSTEDIEKAKSLLFQSVSTDIRQIKRKNKEGKSKKDLFDVIEVFKNTDPEKIPVFVAQDLNKLPPITFDHVDVTRVLKDIVILQNEIKLFKSTYATVDQLQQTKEELLSNIRVSTGVTGISGVTVESLNESCVQNDYRNINHKRGTACMRASLAYDSGPMGLPHLSSLSLPSPNLIKGSKNDQPDKHDCDRSSPLHESVAVVNECEKHVLFVPNYKQIVRQVADKNVPTVTSEVSTLVSASKTDVPVCDVLKPTNDLSGTLAVAPSNSGLLSYHSFAEVASAPGEWKKSEHSGEWTEVQRNRHKNRFMGQKGVAVTTPQCKFKAADIRLPLFINNVDKGTSPADIANYIMTKTQVSVTLEKIKMKQFKEYDAYKIFVPRHKLATFMDDRTWPDGLTFRRFIDFRNRKPFINNQNGQSTHTQ